MKGQKLPCRAYAVLDGEGLSLTDYRLPLMWLRSTAVSYNNNTLNGTGKIVRVRVVEEPKR